MVKKGGGYLVRAQHLGRINPFIELFRGQVTQGQGGFFEGATIGVGFLGNLSALVVTDVAVEGSDQHEGFLHDLIDLFFVSLDTHHAVFGEGFSSISEKTNGLSQVLDQHRLVHIQLKHRHTIKNMRLSWRFPFDPHTYFKVAIGTGNGDSCVVTHDLSAHLLIKEGSVSRGPSIRQIKGLTMVMASH